MLIKRLPAEAAELPIELAAAPLASLVTSSTPSVIEVTPV